jgi:serine protease Do
LSVDRQKISNGFYTLRRDQDPIPALNTFFVWLANQKAKPSLYESGTIPYINVQERLEQF